MEKRKNNKGFSLVELIVVVAIMAVLMTVLAPQLLRYVERTRLQRDNSAISEIANAIEIALANEAVINDITWTAGANPGDPATTTVVLENNTTTDDATIDLATLAGGATNAELYEELQATIGDDYTTASNAYNASDDDIVITIAREANGTITISATAGWIAEVGENPSDAADPDDDYVF